MPGHSLIEHDIVELEVAVDDALVMQILQCAAVSGTSTSEC